MIGFEAASCGCVLHGAILLVALAAGVTEQTEDAGDGHRLKSIGSRKLRSKTPSLSADKDNQSGFAASARSESAKKKAYGSQHCDREITTAMKERRPQEGRGTPATEKP